MWFVCMCISLSKQLFTALSFGGACVDKAFLLEAASRLPGINQFRLPDAGGNIDSVIAVKVLKKNIVLEFDVQTCLEAWHIHKAKIEFAFSGIVDFQVIKGPSVARTLARINVNESPKVAVGLQEWNQECQRRSRTRWSGTSNAAMPPSLHKEVLQAHVYELMLLHTKEKADREFALIHSSIASHQETVDQAQLKVPDGTTSPSAPHKRSARSLDESEEKPKRQKLVPSAPYWLDSSVKGLPGNDYDEKGDSAQNC